MFGFEIDRFFRTELSSEGSHKRQLLTQRIGVIAPCFQGSGAPAQRIRWEFIKEHIRSHKSRAVTAMKTARQNALAGNVLESLETVGVVEVFVKHMLQMFTSLFRDFDPNNGFDLDVILFVNSTRDMTQNQVLVEIYPRRQRGQVETAFCTAQPLMIPFLAFDGEDDELLHTLVFVEARAAGEEADSIHARWMMHRGIWPLKETKTIGFFLERCCHGAVHDPSGKYIRHEHAVTASGEVVRAGLDLKPVMRIVR
jgi:hypothetical protein